MLYNDVVDRTCTTNSNGEQVRTVSPTCGQPSQSVQWTVPVVPSPGIQFRRSGQLQAVHVGPVMPALSCPPRLTSHPSDLH